MSISGLHGHAHTRAHEHTRQDFCFTGEETKKSNMELGIGELGPKLGSTISGASPSHLPSCLAEIKSSSVDGTSSVFPDGLSRSVTSGCTLSCKPVQTCGEARSTWFAWWCQPCAPRCAVSLTGSSLVLYCEQQAPGKVEVWRGWNGTAPAHSPWLGSEGLRPSASRLDLVVLLLRQRFSTCGLQLFWDQLTLSQGWPKTIWKHWFPMVLGTEKAISVLALMLAFCTYCLKI